MHQNARGDRNTEHSKVGSSRVSVSSCFTRDWFHVFHLSLLSCLPGLVSSGRNQRRSMGVMARKNSLCGDEER